MEPVEVTYQLLREITDDFSKERIIGRGGFGTVYKGLTKTGCDVAVKKPDNREDLDDSQFRNEFYNLIKVKHDNIVRFLGYCYETERTQSEFDGRTVIAEKTRRALCFEYLPNGSLQKHLSNESCGLDWQARYKIIKGTCEGLRYIHEEESLLHLDLKPDNILLDKDMVPKIADFGLSKILGDELTRNTKSPLVMTLGYQPREFIEKGETSKKCDIFSLGVIIIRIVSGQEGYPKCLYMTSDKFIDQVQINWRKRWLKTYSTDFSLETCYYCRQIERCTQIALDCLEEDSKKRPDIVKIIDKLKEIETDNSKLPQKRGKTDDETKLTKKHKVEIESDKIQQTSSDVGKELIVGREDEKERLASFLASMSESIIIFPICGIGGIGKTTFARLICNDTNFKYYSQVWVYVSPRFDLREIGNSIISQLSGKENQANELQEIKICITKLLTGKKILIVLDDLWENNAIKLEDLKDMLNPCDSIKTIVLVTTRSEDIAKKICSNIEPYKIEALTGEMCWDIIRQKSGFEARHDKEKLVGIGKDIARKCGGVALAAQTLGSMLQSKQYVEWMTVKDSEIWNETISNDTSLPNHVLASLKLSYVFSMDDCLKSCFTYCAIFSKGHKIVKYDLIYQWVSLGFIKPTILFSTLQLCEKYIERLQELTFFQNSMSQMTYQAYGEHDTVFTMHDLVHDLAISLLGDKILDQSKQDNTIGRSSCCYALLTDCSNPLESCMTSPAGLSALRFVDCWRTELHGAALEPAEFLRVLDLSECSIQKLPDSIGQLKQLGYFNAPRIRDRMIPECITKLSNLRYLSLRGSCAIKTLPDSIGEMEGLVHLDLSGCVGMEKLPESFGDLKILEHVDFTNCKNLTGALQCLAGLTKLQYLNLSNCKNIGHLPRALGSLTELQYLNLSDSSCLYGNELAEAEVLGSLTKLKYLNLSSKDRLNIIRLPEALGMLTELKYLNIALNSSMIELPASFGKLCNLVHLDLSHCNRLRDVPAALKGLTKLQYLDLCECSNIGVKLGQEVLGSLSELRHLNLKWCIASNIYHPDELNSLLERICTLTNLENLNLSNNDDIYSMPKTLGNLRKLHTLNFSNCHMLERLPESISEIDSLKFLYTDRCSKLDRSTLPQYNTGDDESSSFPFQFEHYDHNPGFLQISKLENVTSAKQAQTVKLMEKTHITELGLVWTIPAKRFVDEAEVLRELEPPHSVSKFWIQGYNSVRFPSWVMRISTYLPGLTSFRMGNLPNCHNLPPLGQLPNLKKLYISRMNVIKKIGVDLYGGTGAFPRLEEFTVSYMKCLEEWNTSYSSDEGDMDESAFPCLSSIDITYCPRLRIKPRLPQSLDKLRVHSSDQVMLSSWGNSGDVVASAATRLHVESCEVPLHQWSLLRHLPSLECLDIKNCYDLTYRYSSLDFLGGPTSLRTLIVGGGESGDNTMYLPEKLGDLTSLTELEIRNCKGIKALPDTIRKLTSLQTLSCNSIVSLSLPEWLGHLTSLTRLKIDYCSRIKIVPNSIRQLTRLQVLTVELCRSIVSLPEWLGDLTSLMKLQITNCESIKILPGSIQQLTRLQTLTVVGCESIISLPERLGDLVSLTELKISRCKLIKTLPDSIRQLTCLQTLKVGDCKRLASLPETLGDLNSLKELDISYCRGIKTLPDSIKQLTRLQTLTVHGCKSIKTLPGTIQELTSLQRLEIFECPELVRWCVSVENKMNIAHIKDRNFKSSQWSRIEDSESDELSSDEELETVEETESDEELETAEETESDEELETAEETECDEESENEDLESDPEEK